MCMYHVTNCMVQLDSHNAQSFGHYTGQVANDDDDDELVTLEMVS